MSEPSTETTAGRGRGPGLFRTAWRHSRTKVGVALTGLIVLIAALGPVVAPYPPAEFVAKPFETGVDSALFGRDERGHDVLLAFPQLITALLVMSILGSQVWLIHEATRKGIEPARTVKG